jgi:hypothetical protein
MFWGVGLVLGVWMVFGSVVCSGKCGLFWGVWFVLGSVDGFGEWRVKPLELEQQHKI